MPYVDGFVIAVPTANKQRYLDLAKTVAPMFKEYGALNVVECWGDDVPEGEVTSFPMAVKCQPDETVVFAWILWPSRQIRDEGMAKAMADPRMGSDRQSVPFEGKRMIFGGFEVILDE